MTEPITKEIASLMLFGTLGGGPGEGPKLAQHGALNKLFSHVTTMEENSVPHSQCVNLCVCVCVCVLSGVRVYVRVGVGVVLVVLVFCGLGVCCVLIFVVFCLCVCVCVCVCVWCTV